MGALCRSLFAVSAIATLAFASPAGAQTKYPVSSVTLVTHSSPGGGSDVFLRELSKYLASAMGVTFVVENVRGGGGANAMARVAKAPADGSVFYATTPTYIQTTLMSKPAVGYDGLDPVVTVFLDPEVVYTRADAPFKSLTDAVNHAKQAPGRGKWGAASPGSLERIALEKMNKLTGARAAVVPHDGGGDMMVNILNSTLDIGVGEVQEIYGQLQTNKVRLLASLTDKRIDRFPSLPTAREQGIDLVVTKFRGLAGPKKLPANVIAAWESAMPKILQNPEYKKVYERENLVPHFKGQKDSRALTAAFAKETEQTLRELGVIK
jgi:tripartite-type tricarboxylate transporter receptor subunit TctC